MTAGAVFPRAAARAGYYGMMTDGKAVGVTSSRWRRCRRRRSSSPPVRLVL